MRISPGGMAGLPLIAAAAFFMQALDATILNTALPAIAESLGESPLAMQMTVVGYTLTVALLIPASGWFADRFGTRNVFLFAVALFVLGSLSCALSGSLRMLVLSRVKLVAVLNFISIPGLVGPVVGPLLGGALVTYAGWHWIFLINIPVGLAGMLYAWRIMPQFTGPHGPFDFTGFAFFGLGLALFSGGLELFGGRAESKGLAPFLLLAGVALLTLYARHARRNQAPLIRLGVFRIHTFRVGIAGNVVSRLGTGCMPYLMPLMLQVGLGHPALTAGMMMAPMALGSLTAKTFAVRVLRRFGYRNTLVGVTACIGLMIAQFSLQTPSLPLWMLILPMILLGMAMSTQFTAMNSITLGDLAQEHVSTGNSLLAVTQQLSISFGVASSTAVLRLFNALAPGSLLDHFHETFLTVGGVTLLASLVFLFLRRGDGDALLPGRGERRASSGKQRSSR